MTNNDIMQMARQAGSEDGTTRPDKNIVLYAAKTNKFLERFAALVAAAEREACAKVCDARYMGDNNREDMEARRCAAAIRARSET